MAIATALAVAGIAAAGSIAGGVMSAKAQKSAANKAADTSMQTAQMNNDLAKDIYGQNKQVLSPYQQRGNEAGNAINSLLGLGQPQQQQVQPMSNQQVGSFGGQNPFQGGGFGGIMGGFGNVASGQWRENMSGEVPGYMGGSGYGDGAIEQRQMQNPQADYNNAFDNYRNSTGYQFRTNEGVRALDAAASAGGVRNSGAAQKSLMNYGQNIASGEFNNYLALLANQQGVGLSGASAQAGVGQNYVNNVTANNNSAGTAAANAQLFRGQATANMWGNIGQAAGTFASSFK